MIKTQNTVWEHRVSSIHEINPCVSIYLISVNQTFDQIKTDVSGYRERLMYGV